MGLAIERSGCTDDVGQLEHGGCGSEVFQESLDRIRGALPNLLREVGIDLGGPQTAVSEIGLDDADVDAIFQEVGGVGVAAMSLAT